MNSSRNIYKQELDFRALAQEDDEFRKCLNDQCQLDFTDPASFQQLTCSLLKRDFGLKISLPDDRLCPPIPNRLNYLLWIEDLLSTTKPLWSKDDVLSREIVGLDVGTGASCIYPLLCCSMHKTWKFIATDIDDKSLDFASKNVLLNHLENRIELVKTSSSAPILDVKVLGNDKIDFTMCNPPFYASQAELDHSASLKRKPPNSACTGSANEMVCIGGEVAFVSQMIRESLTLRDKVQWFSSMLGKFESVTTVVQFIRGQSINNFAVMEFVQGNKTRRWAVGWSFQDMRPASAVARGIASLPKHLMPFPSEYTFQTTAAVFDASTFLQDCLKPVEIHRVGGNGIHFYIGISPGDVWSRSYRRKLKQGERAASERPAQNFAFRLEISQDPSTTTSNIMVHWLQGQSSVLFESFCGFLKRQVNTPSRSLAACHTTTDTANQPATKQSHKRSRCDAGLDL